MLAHFAFMFENVLSEKNEITKRALLVEALQACAYAK